MAEGLASMVAPSMEVEEVASIVVPSQVEVFAVALVASLLASLVVDSRVCIRACRHMNAFVLANASSDCVNHIHGGGGACDILLPRG